MNILKDFWYLYFVVEIESKPKKYFLNYKRAKKYYHAQKSVSKSYYGDHILHGKDYMHRVITNINI